MTDVRSPLPASDPDPLPDRLGERFELAELIGRGTCSEVYRAHDLLLDREAAVKIFPVADDPRVEREVRLMASMDHPSLVPVYDVGHAAGRAFVVMALLEGGSLADRLAHGPLGVGETLLAVASVADGLSHVHRAGVLHRDITPRNVLFDGDGRAHLSDFGVAFVADAPRITDTGIVVGSAPYLAPEQVRGEAVGAPADVYALGLVMIEALTARPAYEGAPLAAARARLERRPAMPAGLEFEVMALLEAMTADDPAHRPPAENVCIGLRRAALAAEAATPPYAMAPIVGAGTPDASTETLGPVAATTALGAAAGATPPLSEVPQRRRRGLADAGGLMVAATVAAAVLLAGGVVVASAWTVDHVNTATPPAATVAPPTAEVVAQPEGTGSGPYSEGSSGGSSSDDSSADGSSSDDSSSGSSDDGDGADDQGYHQPVAVEHTPSTAPDTDGGSASTPPGSSSSAPEPTGPSPSPTHPSPSSPSPTSPTSPSPTGSARPPVVPGLPSLPTPSLPTPSLPTPSLPGGPTTTTPGATTTPGTTTPGTTTPGATTEPTTGTTTEGTTEPTATTEPSTTEPSTTEPSTTEPSTTSTTEPTTSATAQTSSSSPSTDTTTTTTTTTARTKRVLGPAVEALGGVLGR